MGFISHLCLYLFAGAVCLSATAFVFIDMLGRIEVLKAKLPWIEKILERRAALCALLVVSIFLQLGVGYELLEKEIPQVPEAPQVIFKLPAPPCANTPANPANAPRGSAAPKVSGKSHRSSEEGPRVFTSKDPIQLLSFYHQGLTTLQADTLFAPFGGLWIRSTGKVYSSGGGRTSSPYLMIEFGSIPRIQLIECRFDPKWVPELERLSNGDRVTILGKLSGDQNGAQLYVSNCELGTP